MAEEKTKAPFPGTTAALLNVSVIKHARMVSDVTTAAVKLAISEQSKQTVADIYQEIRVWKRGPLELTFNYNPGFTRINVRDVRAENLAINILVNNSNNEVLSFSDTSTDSLGRSTIAEFLVLESQNVEVPAEMLRKAPEAAQ